MRAEDVAALEQLVDTVFTSGKPGAMFAGFPRLFCESNWDNLWVHADGETVVSHVGMMVRWASLAGCTVRVACVGAVATFESHRGRGLATELFAAAQSKALAEGVDFLLISGGRGLYRRAGAAEVGCDYNVEVDARAAAALPPSPAELTAATVADLPVCRWAYRQKAARFVRPPEDWESVLCSRGCGGGDVGFLLIRQAGRPCAYVVFRKPDAAGASSVVEFGGEQTAVAAAVKPLMAGHGIERLCFHLQGDDFLLRTTLESAGAVAEPARSPGTLLIINFAQLMARLRPYFEEQIGLDASRSLAFGEQEAAFTFVDAETSCLVPGRASAAEFVFGRSESRPASGPLATVFPVPTLVYGLNYT